MARSYHRNIYSSYCCINHSAQTKWKRGYNRNFRRIAKQQLDLSLTVANDDYYYETVKKQNYADIWCSPSDGFRRVKRLTSDEFKAEKLRYARYWRFCKNYQDYLNHFKKDYVCK